MSASEKNRNPLEIKNHGLPFVRKQIFNSGEVKFLKKIVDKYQ
jgi:hypothetical protein